MTQSNQIISTAACPRCDWLGTFDESAGQTICPVCGAKTNPLRQKGLDNLRIHYRALRKVGYSKPLTREQRATEQQRLEQFFASIGQPL